MGSSTACTNSPNVRLQTLQPLRRRNSLSLGGPCKVRPWLRKPDIHKASPARKVDKDSTSGFHQGPEASVSTKVRIYGCNLHLFIHHRIERLAKQGRPSMCITKWLQRGIAEAVELCPSEFAGLLRFGLPTGSIGGKVITSKPAPMHSMHRLQPDLRSLPSGK
jgi:hypothetical protein